MKMKRARTLDELLYEQGAYGTVTGETRTSYWEVHYTHSTDKWTVRVYDLAPPGEPRLQTFEKRTELHEDVLVWLEKEAGYRG